MLTVIYGLVFGSGALLGLGLSRALSTLLDIQYFTRRVSETVRMSFQEVAIDLYDLSSPRKRWIYTMSPIVGGVLGLVIGSSWIGGLIGAMVGLVAPKPFFKQLVAARRRKFLSQLVDMLLLVSSSLRAGMSMLQAFTVVAEEMPPPISEEFELLLKETSMGVSLDEAMTHFLQRMPSDETSLFVTSVLVARETGGDVTNVFTKLIETLRERRKIAERIKTLTFMARMQGFIMVLLPVVFSYSTYTMDPGHFSFFIQDPTGRMLLMGVIGLQSLSMFLFFRFSRPPTV